MLSQPWSLPSTSVLQHPTCEGTLQASLSPPEAISTALPAPTIVATDNVPYAHQMDEVLSASPALRNTYAPWPFVSEVKGRRQTGYETQWREEGRPMHFFAYQRPGAEPDDG